MNEQIKEALAALRVLESHSCAQGCPTCRSTPIIRHALEAAQQAAKDQGLIREWLARHPYAMTEGHGVLITVERGSDGELFDSLTLATGGEAMKAIVSVNYVDPAQSLSVAADWCSKQCKTGPQNG